MSYSPTSAVQTRLTSNIHLALPIKSRAVLDQLHSSCTFKGYIANLTADKKVLIYPASCMGTYHWMSKIGRGGCLLAISCNYRERKTV